MQRLGHTRSSYQRDHLLQTPDTFIRCPLPGMEGATAIVHASPAMGAHFSQYTAELERHGKLGMPAGQRFLYMLEGELAVEGRLLGPQEFAYFPEGYNVPMVAQDRAVVMVIEKPYRELEGVKLPAPFFGDERQIEGKPLLDDCDIQVRGLMPEDAAFDFAVNTMAYQPGAALPVVEIHVMEHGLLMLEGGGIYRLGDHWYPTAAGDFIWMAPYCPQWFGALGKRPSKYLIYKDWNR
jgi:(S)-ureidoglycine aminohydrolase